MAKKILSILCVLLCLCLVLTACGDTDSKKETAAVNQTDNTKGDPAPDNQQTESTSSNKVPTLPWELAIQPENFNNVTVKLDVTFTDESPVHQPDDNVYAINGNAIRTGSEETFAENAMLVEHVKTLMINPVRDLIANANVLYMVSEGVYTIDTSECAVNYSAYQATITITDAILSLDEDGHLASFDCKMMQDIKIDGEENVKLEMEVTFTFSNYGTTGVSE